MKGSVKLSWKERYFLLEAKFAIFASKIAALEAENQALRLENQQLKAKIVELEEKLSTNSKNSSKPPSQDPFRPKRSSEPTGKKPGGQPGHPGHARQIYPLDQVIKVVELKPPSCPNCGADTFETTPISIELRQTIELPAIQPEITQYNIYTCQCEKCGKHVRASVPPEAERGFGPRLMGFVTMLAGEAGSTKRKICAITGHLGIKVSLGALCGIHRLASSILEKPYEAIRETVLQSENVNGDESSWKLKAKTCWLWIGATPGATFFKIDPSRSQKAFQRIFGDFQNTLTTDRYGAYNTHTGPKQACLAHIKRDFTKMSERKGPDGALGRILCWQLDLIFGLWKRYKAQEFSRTELQKKCEGLIESIKDALTIAASADKIESKSAALCCDLLQRFPSLWRFLHQEGVEPTNNLAERGLRPAVIFRKITGGSQSEWGLTFAERLLTVACTLRQRTKNIFEFLTESFRARIESGPAPPVLAP